MHTQPTSQTAISPSRRRRIAGARSCRTGRPGTAAVSLTVSAEAHTTKPTIVLVHGAWADSTSWLEVTLATQGRRLPHGGPRARPEQRRRGCRDRPHRLGQHPGQQGARSPIRTAVSSPPAPPTAVRTSPPSSMRRRSYLTKATRLPASAPTSPRPRPSGIWSSSASRSPRRRTSTWLFPSVLRSRPQQPAGSRVERRTAAVNFPIVTTPSGSVGWHNVPAWYAVSGQDRMIDPAQERWMAARVGATIVEYSTASHVGGITPGSAEASFHRPHRTRGPLSPGEVTAKSWRGSVAWPGQLATAADVADGRHSPVVGQDDRDVGPADAR